MPNRLSRFWQELKRRRVIHVIVVYVSVTLVIIELVNNVFEPLQLPDWTPTLIIVLLIVGFPLAIVFSWIYDITSKGISRTLPSGQIDALSDSVTVSDRTAHFENSIAVLPFEDMSPDQDQEYFCDGVAEEIINVLTHVDSLKVIARTSSFVFKNKQVDMRKIGQILNVENLLEGSIRLHKERIRITVQLINTSDGAHLWSEHYDRSLDDIFAIQDEISLTIVEALKVKLLGEEKAMILKRHTENLEAYKLYLKGVYLLQLLTSKGIKSALDHFKMANERDPGFALPYAGLALAYLTSNSYGTMAPGDAYPRVIEYAEKAMAMDHSLMEVFMMQGMIHTFYHWNWTEAEKNFKRALELNPNASLPHSFYSYLLISSHRYEEAISEAQKAAELDPISSFANTAIGQAYFYSHQYKHAIRELRKVISREPGYFQAHMYLGFSYMAQKRYLKSYSELRKAIKTSDGLPMVVSVYASVNYSIGRKKLTDKLLKSLIERSSFEYINPLCIYIIYQRRGERDLAFKWFEKACNEHDNLLPWMRINIIETSKRINDPRYIELLDRVGLSY